MSLFDQITVWDSEPKFLFLVVHEMLNSGASTSAPSSGPVS